VSLAIWDHTVLPATRHKRTHPSQRGWYSIYRPFKGGGLSKPRPRVQRATGLLLLRDSPETARTEPTALRLLVQHANPRLSRHPLLLSTKLELLVPSLSVFV